jgi:membrane protein implicated in regulation of membrane protease activity
MSAQRRKAVILAASCAILGGFVPLGLHGHRWIAFVCIAAQAVLLVMALRFFVQSNRQDSASNK